MFAAPISAERVEPVEPTRCTAYVPRSGGVLCITPIVADESYRVLSDGSHVSVCARCYRDVG